MIIHVSRLFSCFLESSYILAATTRHIFPILPSKIQFYNSKVTRVQEHVTCVFVLFEINSENLKKHRNIFKCLAISWRQKWHQASGSSARKLRPIWTKVPCLQCLGEIQKSEQWQKTCVIQVIEWLKNVSVYNNGCYGQTMRIHSFFRNILE